MRISRSTGYALLAVGYIARNKDKKIILSQDISKQFNIPLEYLLKILQQLVRANVLHSKTGPRGGYSLAIPANKVTMLQIIEAIDGPMVSHLSLAEQTHRSKSVSGPIKSMTKRFLKPELFLKRQNSRV